MHAEGVEIIARLHHHIEQVRHRCALVAADIRHARLQQCLGHREDALAAKSVTVAQFERFNFGGERNFHACSPLLLCWLCVAPCVLPRRRAYTFVCKNRNKRGARKPEWLCDSSIGSAHQKCGAPASTTGRA